MTNWDTLSHEIHDHILRLFCKDVIDTYTSLGSRKNIARHYERCQWMTKTTGQSDLQWPAAPLCLQHISSATKVCRFFYHSIVHRIKIHAVAPMKHLQYLQYRAVYRIIRFLQAGGGAISYGRVDVGFFMSLTGVFWKNPKTLENEETIVDVLRVLQETSVMMFVPHLKEWLRLHANSGDAEDSHGHCIYVNLRRPFGDLIDMVVDVAVFGTRGTGSLRIDQSGNFAIFTIDGLYQGSQSLPRRPHLSREDYRDLQSIDRCAQLAKYPILQLIEDTEPHSWWVFALDDPIFSKRAFLVNFEQRIFWHRSMENVICMWKDGEGMWDPESWSLAEALSPQARRSETISEVFDKMEDGEDNVDSGESEDGHATQSDTDSSATSVFDMDDDEEDEDASNVRFSFFDPSFGLI
jgi:hypothetical protein